MAVFFVVGGVLVLFFVSRLGKMSSSWLWLIVVLCAVVGACGQDGGEEIEVVRAVKVSSFFFFLFLLFFH